MLERNSDVFLLSVPFFATRSKHVEHLGVVRGRDRCEVLFGHRGCIGRMIQVSMVNDNVRSDLTKNEQGLHTSDEDSQIR